MFFQQNSAVPIFSEPLFKGIIMQVLRPASKHSSYIKIKKLNYELK